MHKTFNYKRTRFSADIIKEASIELFKDIDFKKEKSYLYLSLNLEEGKWNYDNEEEFFNDYRRAANDFDYNKHFEGYEIEVKDLWNTTVVKVKAPTREKIQSVFNIFDKHAESSRLPEPPEPIKPPPPKPTIFIGHGHNPQWKNLKDHLHEKHKYNIEAYEIGARAGHVIRDILQDMLSHSSFALLVMTGEDEMQDGTLRARQNVIHEVGLFQGKLGFHRAIVLLEDGTEDFSNLQGIEQIRFSKGNIKETYGDVLAVLHREFREKKDLIMT